jgi:hypothetical protein
MVCSGFNPRVVDVGELAAENIENPFGDARCLIWNSKGIVDEKTYSLMEGWVAGGGNLVTAPIPPTQTMRGYPARYTPLFPLAPTRVQLIDRFRSYATMGMGLLKYWLFHRSRLREEHLSSGHVIELYEPLLHLLSTPVKGLIHEQKWGDPLPGDYVAATYDLRTAPRGMEIEPGPLRNPRLPAGLDSSYRVHHGKGTSTVLGTLPGGRYATPRYYTVDPETRKTLCNFMRGMLGEWGIQSSYETEIEAEMVAHKAPDGGGFLFIINRLGRQQGRVHLRRPREWGYHGHLRIAFTLLGSGAVVVNEDTIEVDLFPQDVLVLTFPPAS